jgi:hypothetical protein
MGRLLCFSSQKGEPTREYRIGKLTRIRCAALHTFILPESFDTPEQSTSIQSFQTEHPILDFTPLPSHPNQYLISLDTAFGTLTKNQTGWGSGKRELPDLTEDDVKQLRNSLLIVEVGKSGIVRSHPSKST